MRILKPLASLSLALVMTAAAAFASSAGEQVRIAGDPCSVPLISALAEAYSRTDAGFSAEVTTVSCTLGVFKAADGEFDIGVSTQNGLSQNLPRGAANRVIAKSPIVLVVNRANPVKSISYAQLKALYSGEIKNWRELGGGDMEITNVMLAPCVRNTLSKQVIPYSPEIKLLKPAQKVNPVTYTNKLVAENPGAIGEQIYGYESKDVNVLKIDGLLPDPSTLPGTYTFYQDFNVVTHGEPTGKVLDFISFINSEAGRNVILSLKHIPAG